MCACAGVCRRCKGHSDPIDNPVHVSLRTRLDARTGYASNPGGQGDVTLAELRAFVTALAGREGTAVIKVSKYGLQNTQPV